MKKRLLSAALAFAMALTLIPFSALPAFAVEYGAISSTLPSATVKSTNATTGVSTYYYESKANPSNPGSPTITTVTVTRFTGGNDGTNRVYGHWYWLNNSDAQNPVYHEVTSGYIAGDNGTGQWYPDISAFTTTSTGTFEGVAGQTIVKLRSSSVTLLGGASLNMNDGRNWSDTTLRVDIEGAGTLSLAENASNVTVTSRFQSTQVGTVNAITRDHSAYSTVASGSAALILSATNVNVGAISLTGRGNSVTLDSCKAAGITMNGNYLNSATAVAPNYTWAGQTLSLKNNTTVNGAIVVNGDNNRITIADTDATGQPLTVTGAGPISISGTTQLDDVTANARGATGAYPGVTVSGGTVGDITQGTVAGNKNSITVTVSNTNTQTGAITVDKGTVNLTNGNVAGDVTVKAGALNATQDNVHVSGNLLLGDTDTTTLNLTASNSTFGGITVNTGKGSNLNITGWNGKRQRDGGNNYGAVDLDAYAGKKVSGGSFAAAQTFDDKKSMGWLTSDVQFYVKNGTASVDLYGKNELARAISDITTTNAKTDGNIIVVGQTDAQDIILMNGQNVWAKIGYNVSTPLVMPESVNGMKIAQWYAPDNHNIIITSGVEQGIPYTAGDLKLNASGVTAEAKRITKATVASSNPSGVVQNQNVRVSLNGNVITLSGAVEPGNGGMASILIDLETDAVNEDGTPMILRNVVVDCYEQNGQIKQIKFNLIQPTTTTDAGGIIQDNGATLALNNGTGEKYTLSGSLTVSASTLGIYMGAANKSPIVVTTGGKLSSWTALEKQALIDQIQANGSFTIGNNRAVQEAINAAQATITSNNTVAGWVTNAKNTVWRQGYKKPNVNAGTAPNTGTGGYAVSNGQTLTPNTGAFDSSSALGGEIASLFTKAYIVPYLVVNITDYDRNGALTATLTPYYRVDVSGATYSPDFYYTVQAGRAMSALTGSMCLANGLTVDLGLADPAFQNKYMHQDGKYVYAESATEDFEWTITHAGTNGNGLGTIVINNIPGPITMASNITDRTPTIAQLGCAYDTLQAAIDDTVRGATIQNTDGTGSNPVLDSQDTITIGGAYTGDCTVNMTGIARRIVIIAQGQQTVTSNAKDVDVQSAGGYTYTVQLKNDAVAAGTVALAVQGTAQGTVTLPATTAKVGQVVTVTVVPVSGQTARGVTVTTNDGTRVPAASTGEVNKYSFTVPTGATSITITPNFGTTLATFAVSTNAYQGTAQAITGTADGKVAQGATVPVTVTPNSGYRTIGLTARGNNGTTAVISRTGNNTFNVTVPAGATTVTLSPSFDIDNKTPFTDVLSSSWASPDVAWMYQNGYTTGYGDSYHFAPTTNATRWEMVYFLYKAAGYPSVSGMSNPFRDVNSSNFYYNAVIWAANRGLVDSSTGYFNATSPISRADVVNIIWLHKGSPSASTTSGFKDVSPNAYYARAVSWAERMGITNGKDNRDTFKPTLAITRQEIAKMLHVAFGTTNA